MEYSKIEWCDHTLNLWWGCTKVSPGCQHCYADSLSNRFGKDIWGPGKPREDHRKNAIRECEKWNRKAEKIQQGFEESFDDKPRFRIRPRVFVASMSDWLDPEVPIEWLADLLDLVRRCQHLDFLLLTKRPELFDNRVQDASDWNWENEREDTQEWLAFWLRGIAPHNVWVGTSVEDQTRADERIPALLRIPAKVRFLSCEPLLGPVDLTEVVIGPSGFGGNSYTDALKCPEECLNTDRFNGATVHWVIVGGESGPKARPMNVEWARSLRDQCQGANVPFFMKQMGGTKKPFRAIPEDLMIREFPKGII